VSRARKYLVWGWQTENRGAQRIPASRPSDHGCERARVAVHSLDQMILHRADSGHSLQVQQSRGSEGRFTQPVAVTSYTDIVLNLKPNTTFTLSYAGQLA